MDKKEQIILAAVELASENGLGSVSMSQIAGKLGMRKPSLYNHFESKDAIIQAMYEYLREGSKKKLSLEDTDYGEFVKDKTAEQALSISVGNYISMNSQKEITDFYRLIYSQRAVDAAAARIMKDETQRMILATKQLFYALQVHGKLDIRDIDTAAESFALTVHSITDLMLDCKNCGEEPPEGMLERYIRWFCREVGGAENNEE
ncbi:MAG: TetR/AcrR family transcriptional regulator [Ruminococcus sp.]|nr:TetR/AcrR family transcriptional regulator [Ruminococcus sp.]